jgi:hypothetical protein
MIDKVRAKFHVSQKTEFKEPAGSASISLRAVHKYDPDETKKTGCCTQTCEENKIFGELTPMGTCEMTIRNPVAAAYFKIGKEYYLDFTEASE